MKIVLFCHPSFSNSQSMPRFANMLYQAYLARGHVVEVWRPEPHCRRWHARGKLAKWLGYIDQFVLFPAWVKKALQHERRDTLFVFCDQALGPWVKLVVDRPHVIHCHDFLALQSAEGKHPKNPVRWSGRIYQRFIRNGFCAGRYFISVSHHTASQLLAYLPKPALISSVVHNGLNFPFYPLPETEARERLANVSAQVSAKRMLVHVGGNVWYKNRAGVLHIYRHYCNSCAEPLPLWMVGEAPNSELLALANDMPSAGVVVFLPNLTNEQVQAVYTLAQALIFPSLAEGFGWPIAEAMACGCPVLTTGEAPMTEVGGSVVSYVPLMPFSDGVDAWAKQAATQLHSLLNENDLNKAQRRQAALDHVRRFDAERAIGAYEEIYNQVVAQSMSRNN